MSISKLIAMVMLGFVTIANTAPANAAEKQVDRIVVLGDSLSDDGGDNSTWFLTKTLNGQAGDRGIDHMQPWVRAWLSERVWGYGWFCSWKYVPCRTVEKGILKATAKILEKSGAVPVTPAPHYDNGRWSNGPMWPEYLSQMMGIPLNDTSRYINVSHAGGWSLCIGDKALGIRDLKGDLKTVAMNMVNGSLVPPCLKLIAKGVNYKYGNYHPNDLAILFFGGNDYLNLYQDPARAVNAQAEVIEDAIAKGAKSVAWLNMPNIAQTPRYLNGSGMDKAQETTRLINTHNALLMMRFIELKSKYISKGINVIFVDANKIFKDIIANAHDHGMYVLDQPCSTLPSPGLDDSEVVQNNPSLRAINEMATPNGGICENQSEYMFWDGVHPTTATHKVIAEKACAILRQQGFKCNLK
ncbi:SGNH/GDSL hydrolase family protein [Shewanella sp. 202IG2-18]|uniref:SGNH/GDSL hydrolase family protein n=1 Tax=Parashewanella hymeniacidonis TaxID=2807618 RepID=UPI0019606458|nr:SGNH/GDSL hydrolase family protein [Parashewanella hymeniacidonis]MBM7070839.1 SGNH/GDSL hydrolase family protein [Parashewanella hymeniacidonis]